VEIAGFLKETVILTTFLTTRTGPGSRPRDSKHWLRVIGAKTAKRARTSKSALVAVLRQWLSHLCRVNGSRDPLA